MTQIQHLPADRPEPSATTRYLVVHIHAPETEYDGPTVNLYGTNDRKPADRLARRLDAVEIERSGVGGSAYVLDRHEPDEWYSDAETKNAELDKLDEEWDA